MTEPKRWWRVFGLRRGGGRRRLTRRFAHRAHVSAKCDSWPEFLELTCGDVSAGGMFVATDQDAAVGEAVELRLRLPDGSELPLTGRVAVDGPDGLGIELEPPTGEHADKFEEVLAIAQAAAPRPEPVEREPDPPLFKIPEGARPMRLSAVHEAIGAERIEHIDPSDITGEHALEDIEAAVWEPPIEPGAPPSIAPRGQVNDGGAGLIAGIALGHSRTSIAVVDGERVRLLELGPGGERSIPSAIRDGGGGSISPLHELEDDESPAPIDGCRDLLQRARAAAERRLDQPLRRAVLAVPMRFDEAAIDRLGEAAAGAGIEVVAVIDAPSAVVAANRFDLGPAGLIGVYDFGGASFAFTAVDASGGDVEILATTGARDLGGDDFDLVLAKSAAIQFARAHRVDLRQQPIEWRALLDASEHAKRELSVHEGAAIVVDDVIRNAAGPVDLRVAVTRAIFEQACGHLIERSLSMVDDTLERLGRRPADLSCVLLSGGVTRIPAVRRRLGRALDVPIRSAVPAAFAVCLGAGVHAASLSNRADAVRG